MLEPGLVGDEPFYFGLGVHGAGADGAGVEFDVGLDEEAAEVAEGVFVEEGEELLGDDVVGGHPLDDCLDGEGVDGRPQEAVVVDVAGDEGLHHVEVPHFAVDLVADLLDADYPVAEDAEDEVLVLVVFDAVELQGLAGDVDVLHVDLGGEDEGVAEELPLDHVALDGDRLYHLQLVVYQDHLLQAHHAPDLPPRCPHYVYYYVVVVQPEPQVRVDLVVQQLGVDRYVVGEPDEVLGKVEHHVVAAEGGLEHLLHPYLQLPRVELALLLQVLPLLLEVEGGVLDRVLVQDCYGLLILLQDQQQGLDVALPAQEQEGVSRVLLQVLYAVVGAREADVGEDQAPDHVVQVVCHHYLVPQLLGRYSLRDADGELVQGGELGPVVHPEHLESLVLKDAVEGEFHFWLVAEALEGESVEVEVVVLDEDLLLGVGDEGLEGVQVLGGDDGVVHLGVVVDHVEQHSRVEVDEVGVLVAPYLEVLRHVALVYEQQEQLVGPPHQLLLRGLLHPLEVEREQLHVAVAGQCQEAPRLGLPRVVEPGERLDPVLADLLVQQEHVPLPQRLGVVAQHHPRAGPHQQVLVGLGVGEAGGLAGALYVDGLQDGAGVAVPDAEVAVAAKGHQLPDAYCEGQHPHLGQFELVVVVDCLVPDAVLDANREELEVVGGREVEVAPLVDGPLDEAGGPVLGGLPHEDEGLGLEGVDEDLVGEGEHDLAVLGRVVEDVVVDVEALLAEGHRELVLDQPRVQVLLDYPQPVLGVGEVEHRGGAGVEREAEAARLPHVLAVHSYV